jgi:hypothetical protein
VLVISQQKYDRVLILNLFSFIFDVKSVSITSGSEDMFLKEKDVIKL